MLVRDSQYIVEDATDAQVIHTHNYLNECEVLYVLAAHE